MRQEKWNLETTSFFLSFLPSHINLFSNKLCLSSFSHRQDTTTVTGYSGVPLTKKYSSTKYTHRRYDYIISSGMPKKLTSSTDHKHGASSGSSLTENVILSYNKILSKTLLDLSVIWRESQCLLDTPAVQRDPPKGSHCLASPRWGDLSHRGALMTRVPVQIEAFPTHLLSFSCCTTANDYYHFVSCQLAWPLTGIFLLPIYFGVPPPDPHALQYCSSESTQE